MIEPFLKSQLEPVVRRQRSWRLWRSLTVCWAVSASSILILLLLHRFAGLSMAWLLAPCLLLSVVTAVGLMIRASLWEPDYRQIARDVEQRNPDLHALLLTAVEQKPDPATGRFNFLQQRVLNQTLLESRRQKWVQSVPLGKLAAVQAGHWAALLCLLAIVLNFHTPVTFRPQFSAAGEASVVVTPGDAEVEKGRGLVILARFNGAPPSEAFLVVDQLGEDFHRYPLVRSLDDPVFGGSIPEVANDLLYHVEYGEERTGSFKVSVFEHPRLERADAEVAFPEYTGLPPKEIPDTRRVSAVEGTKVKLQLELNKPVVSARLSPRRGGEDIELTIETNRAAAALPEFTFKNSATYNLILADADGRTNKIPTQIVFNVLENRRPELKLAAPRGDQRVSALEEISFGGEAWDDFGLHAYGLHYKVAGGESKDLVLGQEAAANQRAPFEYLLFLEELGVEVDELLTWHVWADDIGPDGEVRRTYGDKFFGEVRPFEEIFREDASGMQSQQQQQQQQQQGGNEATQLAELQKQIINATWKLQRMESGGRPSENYQKDVTLVRDSQSQALEQASALAQNATDLKSVELMESVERFMKEAVEQLDDAIKTPVPLPNAVDAEESAYAGLLKLAAHEFRVSRNQQGGGGGGGGGRMQQQLDQLELGQNESRYETERQASPLQNEQQREQLQVLSRLKELAQRQEDLNERLQELQNALEEAKTEEEKEEIRRRLERLREEEQEILADVDELDERMSRSENQSQMAESREQLQETRSNVQRAAEALAQEAVSQALASGTRAERDLEDLEEEFREMNSSQFTQEMQEMRQAARELASNQDRIREDLEDINQTRQNRLTDSGETKELLRQLEEQRRGYTNLLENVRTVSEQAENAEPLLSRQLYETYRQASQSGAEDSLNLVENLVRQRFPDEAAPFEEKAREEIANLREGVEAAAESVLGDDTEALRLARRELEELARQLEEEMQLALGGSPEGDPAAMSNQSADPNAPGANEPGEQGNASASPNESGQSDSPGEEATRGQPGQGEQPSPSDRQGEQGQQGQSGQQGSGEQPEGQQAGQEGAQGQASGRQGREGQEGEGAQGGQQGQGEQPSQQGSPGGQGNQGQPGQGGGEPGSDANDPRGERRLAGGSNRGGPSGGANTGGGGNFFDQMSGSGPDGFEGPLQGSDFTEWSDRMRNVEEIMDLPELRNDVATVRDRARTMRAEYKRHGKEPQWDLVKSQLIEPLKAVQTRVGEELALRNSDQALVPIDRDPVPTQFSDLVRRYYEKLGSED